MRKLIEDYDKLIAEYDDLIQQTETVIFLLIGGVFIGFIMIFVLAYAYIP